MKKFLVFLFLMLIGTSVYGQKRYVHIVYGYYTGNSETFIRLSGCIPTDMESSYSNTSVGTIIDKLGQRGYVVEQLSSAGYSSSSSGFFREMVIMSTSSNQTTIKGDVNEDSEVNIADVNEVISLILDKLMENPKLLEELGIVQPK